VAVMITRARVSGCFGSLTVAAVVLLGAAVAAGVLAGGVAGLAGALFDPVTRLVLAGLAAVTVLIGATVRRLPWQLDRETNRRWLQYEDWRTAAYNGFALGLGFTTRIGYWLFYLVPLAAFAVGDPRLSALGWAVYAASRVGGSLLLWRAGLQVAGRNLIPPLRTATDAAAFVALGCLLIITLVTPLRDQLL
jgi:hypothetical protein